MKHFRFFTILFIVASIFLGCKNEGTDTGNPTFGPPSSGVGGIGDDMNEAEPTPFITSLITESCAAIERCHNIENSVCASEWLQLTDVDIEIGLNMGDYSNLEEALNAEIDETITADGTQESTCIDDIRKLSCFGTGIEQAFDPIAASPFDFGAGMIPNSCQTVFDP